MAGTKGIAAREHMRGRSKAQRGGKVRTEVAFPRSEAHNLADYADGYLDYLTVRNYTETTIEGRRYALDAFLQWCLERELICADAITLPILEGYLRHVHRYRKPNGKPLSIAQVEAILSQPDIDDPLGVRDRAMMELLYSTGMRRSELTSLELSAVNQERGTAQVRRGKGRKDRVVPVGTRALAWLERYLLEVRPLLTVSANETALFLTSYGEAFNPDVLSRKVSKYIRQADIGRGGSCHLFRHTCATHMLEGGADIRFIQQLLGHEKLETTQIYTEVSIRQLQEVHARTHPAKL